MEFFSGKRERSVLNRGGADIKWNSPLSTPPRRRRTCRRRFRANAAQAKSLPTHKLTCSVSGIKNVILLAIQTPVLSVIAGFIAFDSP